MKVAIRLTGVQVDEDGHVAGKDAGATLVRRLLRLFPGSQLVGTQFRHCDGFDLVPIELVDGSDSVLINMDVSDSVGMWRRLRATCDNPKIMNFVWFSTSQITTKVERAAFALSCSLFPTFANSEHTATEVKEVVDALTVRSISDEAQIEWVNLGFRIEHVQPRREPETPVVLYPAIYLSERKRPQLFVDVVSKVAKRTPIQVEARLHETHLIRNLAMDLSRYKWAWVGPLTATREGYWQALSRTTAFLATSVEESYGLEYVEALAAGAVGIFPDLPWAREILPIGYPFFYKTSREAEALLYRAVTDTAACRRQLDQCADGDFSQWLQGRHSDDKFEKAIVDRVHEWFGA